MDAVKSLVKFVFSRLLQVGAGSRFYSARNARIASAVLATAIPSVRLSVRPSVCLFACLSVCHTPVLCQNDGT